MRIFGLFGKLKSILSKIASSSWEPNPPPRSPQWLLFLGRTSPLIFQSNVERKMFKSPPPLWADFRLVEHQIAGGKKIAIHRAYYYDMELQNLYGVSASPSLVAANNIKSALARIDDMLGAFERPLLVNPPIIRSNARD